MPRARPQSIPRIPVSTSWASNPHGRPEPSSSRLGSPDLQRSSSPPPPDLLSESLLRLGPVRSGVKESTSSQFQITVQSPPGWGSNGDCRPPAPESLLGSTSKSSARWRGIHWLPSAGSSRGIHSQVSRDRSPGYQIGAPPPRRPRAGGDPPGPHLFPG